MLPFYAFYSMFGFQRVGDLIWAAADSRSRGFLIGATAGRTTLAGEGLQHQDGASHLIASTIQNCVAYDPCFGYELAVILQDGMRRMLQDQEDVFYYVTVMNENYAQPTLLRVRRRGSGAGCTGCGIAAGRCRRQGRRSEENPARTAPRRGHHTARSARRRRDPGAGIRHRRRCVERHQLHRAAPRRPGMRALEPRTSR